MKRNISGRLSSPLLFCIALNCAECGYQVHRTEGKISHLLCVDDWKLLGRNEDSLENEIKIVKAISPVINTKFGIEKYAGVCLKKVVTKAKYI